MKKLNLTIPQNGTYTYPNGTDKGGNFYGISIIAPLPNETYISFVEEPTLFPIETIQCLKCSTPFTGFTIQNNDPNTPITLTIYLQTDPREFLPCATEIQAQVNLNSSPAASYTKYTSLSGSSSSTTPVQLSFDALYSEIDIVVNNAPAVVQIQLPKGVYGPPITLQPGYYAYGIYGSGIQFYAATSQTTNVQVVGLS